jgi:hypothetical protein
MRLMLACAAVLLILVPAARAQNAQFKGLTVLSQGLSTRIAPPSRPFDLDEFTVSDGLDDLLGAWSGFGAEHTFQNGKPNAINVVLLRLTLGGFAKSLAANCTVPRLPLNARFAATLKKVCTWPAPEAASDAVLTGFWLGVMGYDAPRSEYIAWRDFFRARYADKPGPETVEAMTFAIMMNPYFLLN